MSLPAASISIACGSCGDELEFDGDSHVCDECGLDFGDPFDDEPATFLDEEAHPCGHPAPYPEPRVERKPFHTVDGVVKTWRTWTHVYEPCVLPAGHKTRLHHYSLSTTYTTEETKA